MLYACTKQEKKALKLRRLMLTKTFHRGCDVGRCSERHSEASLKKQNMNGKPQRQTSL